MATQVEQHSVPLWHPESLTQPSGMVVLQKMAFARFVFFAKVAPVKSASIRQAPLRFALVKLAPMNVAPRRFARLRLQPVQSRFGGAG